MQLKHEKITKLLFFINFYSIMSQKGQITQKETSLMGQGGKNER